MLWMVCIRGRGLWLLYTYITMTTGSRVGGNFLLDPTDGNRIGRGMECDVVLTDPLCSRIHGIVSQDDDGWWLRDAESRNGTFVDGQKVDEARLLDGCLLRMGSTEFSFHESEYPPTQAALQELNLTQTIIKDSPLDVRESGAFVKHALRQSAEVQDLLLLHELTLRLLGDEDPDSVIRVALETLHQRTRASVVGFLWVNDEGQLKPKLVIPEDAAREVSLSESLTEIVCKKGHAAWISNQTNTGDAPELSHYADAICVPLVHEKQTVGAIHLYLERGKFLQQDFEFGIELATIMVVALVRARKRAILQIDHKRLTEKNVATDEMIGDSAPMADLKSKIARIARATGCVLVRGESGAGKELVASALHKSSTRSDRPMLSVNCAAIPRDLMESQLFGHKKGSYTGAENDHIGWFEQADTGTLFLDEVGELTLEGQAKLLRILEGHPFLPVGATKEVSVDVRVIAATNRDLREFVREKQFREDLYYRLSVFELYIPPLRERGSDIELLVSHFFDHFAKNHGRPDLKISPAARDKLLAYSWPGNVRQLRNVIDSAVVMAIDEEIVPDDLGLRDTGSGELDSLRIDHWERQLIQEALSRTSGNVPEAAKMLGIGRATLYRKIEEYGITR